MVSKLLKGRGLGLQVSLLAALLLCRPRENDLQLLRDSGKMTYNCTVHPTCIHVHYIQNIIYLAVFLTLIIRWTTN